MIENKNVLPRWLLNFKIHPLIPSDIKAKVQEKIEHIINVQNKETLFKFDSFEFEVRYFKTLTPLFTQNFIVELWEDLLSRAPDKTIDFLDALFEFEKTYEELAQFKKNRLSELKQIKRVIIKSEELFSVIQESDNYICPSMFEALGILIKLIDESYQRQHVVTDEITHSKYFNNAHGPLTRQLNAQNHLPIFFIRKIYAEFVTKYHSPMYGHINQIVSTIFGASFSENEVIKHCKRINQIFSENSRH
ncbi:hypothetical protein SCJ60_06220 [Legionella pneumophila serogroup 9]